jgi:hypothetical protein
VDRKATALCGTVLFALLLVAGLAAACLQETEYPSAQPAPGPQLRQPRMVPRSGPATEELHDAVRDAGQQPVDVTPPGPAAEGPLADQDSALSDLRRLAGDEPLCTSSSCYTITNRLTGSEGLRRAMDYIHQSLVSQGYEVEFRNWSFGGYSDRNLIARKSGVYSPTEEVYFVAHLDGASEGADERFPAADDNASGAVANLELARILSSQAFSRTVVLLFPTGEEQGALGVKSYLAQLSREQLSAIKYVVDIDMVGYDGNNDGAMQLWHGDDGPSLALTEMISKTIGAYRLALAPKVMAGCG